MRFGGRSGDRAGSVRTEHGGDEDNGGEEKVSLRIESFMREKKLLDYLYGRKNLSSKRPIKWGGERDYFFTSRQTKSSSGSVVNIFSPKQNRAMLIRVSFSGYIRIGIKSPTQKAQERDSLERSC